MDKEELVVCSDRPNWYMQALPISGSCLVDKKQRKLGFSISVGYLHFFYCMLAVGIVQENGLFSNSGG